MKLINDMDKSIIEITNERYSHIARNGLCIASFIINDNYNIDIEELIDSLTPNSVLAYIKFAKVSSIVTLEGSLIINNNPILSVPLGCCMNCNEFDNIFYIYLDTGKGRSYIDGFEVEHLRKI